MSQAAGGAQAEYDQSGRWPVTEDGWQVVYLQQSLFPGGPSAYKVVAPTVVFFFGLHFEPDSARPEPQTAIVTNLGKALPRFQPSRPMNEMERAQARQHVAAYIMAHGALFHRHPIVSIEFGMGDGRQIDVF